MNATPTCVSCGHGPIESSWKLCPVCGQSVNRDAITTLATKDTKPTEQDQIDRKRVYQQANQDLQNKARWLLFLAVLGAFGVGWILLDRGNFEAGAIAIVISLAILLYLRITGSRSQATCKRMFNQHFGILHSSVLFYALDDCLDHLHAGNLLADGAMMDSLESGRMFYSVFMALASSRSSLYDVCCHEKVHRFRNLIFASNFSWLQQRSSGGRCLRRFPSCSHRLESPLVYLRGRRMEKQSLPGWSVHTCVSSSPND